MKRYYQTRLVTRTNTPELRRLWDELHRRMGSSSRSVTTIRLGDLAHDERVALSELLGRDRLVGKSLRLATEDVARALGIEPVDLRALVESLRGPVPDRAAEKAMRKQERELLWDWLGHRVSRWPLESWVDRIRASGVPGGDVVALRSRLDGVARVLDALPADGVVLSVLARRAVSNPHGLDWGMWTTRRVLSAVATIHRVPAPTNAEEARALWDRVGIVADKHSVGVTTLGLEALGCDPLSRALASMRLETEPLVITLSQLQRWPVRTTAAEVYLFENASMLSCAAGLGWHGPPLISTAGWPNTAVFVLCRQLRESGCHLFHHGDFDPSGIEITRYLVDRAGATPWRMTAADYLALARNSDTQLSGQLADTPWDPRLAEVMRARGKIAYEEDAVAPLLAALSS